MRTNSLDSGVSETLKVAPQRKVLQHITPERGGVGKVQNVINLHFEGNWMPIKVAVSRPPGLSCLSNTCVAARAVFAPDVTNSKGAPCAQAILLHRMWP